MELKDLRKECKEIGVKVKKEKMPWGSHLSFYFKDSNKIIRQILVKPTKKEMEIVSALAEIREKYKGLLFEGQKVYGI